MNFQSKGELGEQIATKLWPNLKLVSDNALNRRGIDAYLEGTPMQIKYDATISKTGNLYHEIYEKDANHPEQDWRHSPNTAEMVIFIAGDFAYKVSISDLALAERNLPLIEIKPTSMGFLIPIHKVVKGAKSRRQFSFDTEYSRMGREGKSCGGK